MQPHSKLSIPTVLRTVFLLSALLCLALLPTKAKAGSTPEAKAGHTPEAVAAATQSPTESNPVFRAFLASLLGSESLPDTEKVQRLDLFFAILERSLGSQSGDTAPAIVKDLQSYIALRNHPYASAEEALIAYQKLGVVTPFSVQVANPAVMEEILHYEATELKAFLRFAKKLLPKSQAGLKTDLQSPIWEALPNLYLLGESFKSALDQNSAELIQKSFQDAKFAQQRGSPTGIFSFMLGVGLSGARAIGEHVVNPLIQNAMYSGTAKLQLQKQALAQVRGLRTWGYEKKLSAVKQFEQGLSLALKEKIAVTANSPALNEFATALPLVDVLRFEVLPEYFQQLTQRQRTNLVWQVLSTPGFAQKSQAEQTDVVLNSLGPVLPHWVRQLAPTGPSARIEASADTLDGVSDDFVREYGPRGFTLLRVQPVALATNEFKDTFEAFIQHAGKSQRVVLQRLRPGVQEKLKDDLEILSHLGKNTLLMNHLKAAGAVEAPALLESLNTLAQDEVDLNRTAQNLIRARTAYGKPVSVKIAGRAVTLEILPSTPVPAAVAASDSNKLLIQEFAEGDTVSEAAKKYPELVTAALEGLSQVLLNEAFTGSGFIWAEPSVKNLRVQVLEDGAKVRLTLLNFGSAGIISPQEMKNVFATIGKLPLKMLPTSNPEILKKIQQAVEAGLQVTPDKLRLAQQLIQLRNLVGPAVFQKQLLWLGLKNPGILWAPLGAGWKQTLTDIYSAGAAPFKKIFGTTAEVGASRPAGSLQSCEQLLTK